jgi:ornithine carbamoyltransferase
MEMNKDLLRLADHHRSELSALIARGIELKRQHHSGVRQDRLAGKIIGLLFEKPSTRTRLSFEAAMYGLGGQVVFLSARDTQLARSEPIKDTARVMSRYVDGMVVRTFGQEVVDELARYASVPVINALTDLHHPCQILSDMMTVIEQKGDIETLHIVWLGDGHNMANSWIEAAAVFGFRLSVVCPRGYEPDPAILAASRAKAARPIELYGDPFEVISDADVINVDVWASMGQEDEQQKRLATFMPYQLNEGLLRHAPADVMVLHCLPAHRDEEITDEVLESNQETIFTQAENKMHVHQAILEHFLTGNVANSNP